MKYKKLMENKCLQIGLVASVLLAFGSYTMATTGGTGDPLLTLSYLTQTVLPSLSEEGKTQAQSSLAATEAEIDKAIAELKAEINGSTSGIGAQFYLVTMTQGQVLTLDLGSQAVLRIGTATASASDNPALVNMTSGSTLNSGGDLTTNHLYLASISNRKIIATASTVKLLVCGGYQLG